MRLWMVAKSGSETLGFLWKMVVVPKIGPPRKITHFTGIIQNINRPFLGTPIWGNPYMGISRTNHLPTGAGFCYHRGPISLLVVGGYVWHISKLDSHSFSKKKRANAANPLTSMISTANHHFSQSSGHLGNTPFSDTPKMGARTLRVSSYCERSSFQSPWMSNCHECPIMV